MIQALTHLGHQFLRYALVGSVATVAHYGVLMLAVELFDAMPEVGAMFGLCAGGTVSYTLNRRFTFASSDRDHRGAIPRFAVIALVAFALTYVLMRWLTRSVELHYMLAQVFTTGLVMIWTFSANRFWTFSDARTV